MDIDTVLAAGVDMQGRLIGKRFLAKFFVDSAHDETHGCNYLLANDIDMEPEPYKHYFLRELPARYHPMVDIRRFGPGERIVFEPYPEAAFERTRRWIESWDLFPPEQKGNAGYDVSVV